VCLLVKILLFRLLISFFLCFFCKTFSGVKSEITKKVGDYSTTLGKVVTRLGNEQLDSYLALLTDAEALNKEGGSKADPTKITEFKSKVEDFIQKGYLKAEEASKLFELAGISNISVDPVTKAVTLYKFSVTNGLKEGEKKLLEGAGLINEENILGIPTYGISASIGKLKTSVSDSIQKAISKIEEGIAKAKLANDWDEVNDLVNERKLAEYARVQRGYQTGGLIPEYHSQGLPVGFKSRGTDTVPAMLTPGEYVLRKKAVDSLGTNFLNNLNKYGVNALQTMNKSTIINNVYNTNNAKISQNIDNKSQYLNGMFGVDKLMRYV